jgi:hypothetical protein
MNINEELQNNPELKLEDKFMNFEWFCNNRYTYGINTGKSDPKIRKSYQENGKSYVKISSIKSNEIRKYYVNKYIFECLKYDEHLKLKDINDYKINKDNHLIIINDKIVDIKYIKSIEILYDFISQMNFNEKEKTKYLLKLISPPQNRPKEYEMYIEVIFNIDMFNSLENKNKLYLVKYIFSTWTISINKISNLLDVFKNFSKNKYNLFDLINDAIKSNDMTQIEYIFCNKLINFNEEDYEKLQELAIKLQLFDIVKILIKYQSLDYILSDD